MYEYVCTAWCNRGQSLALSFFCVSNTRRVGNPFWYTYSPNRDRSGTHQTASRVQSAQISLSGPLVFRCTVAAPASTPLIWLIWLSNTYYQLKTWISSWRQREWLCLLKHYVAPHLFFFFEWAVFVFLCCYTYLWFVAACLYLSPWLYTRSG